MTSEAIPAVNTNPRKESQEEHHARLRAAGWTIEELPAEGDAGRCTVYTPPEGYGTPDDVPYIRGGVPGHRWPMMRADWAPEGVTIWVPVTDPDEFLLANEYLIREREN